MRSLWSAVFVVSAIPQGRAALWQGVHLSGRSAYYFFIVIVIRHETTAAARWALPFIVRTLFNDAITVAVWTGFHVCFPVDTSASLATVGSPKLLR